MEIGGGWEMGDGRWEMGDGRWEMTIGVAMNDGDGKPFDRRWTSRAPRA
jgi:hypothetical protein